MNIAVLFPRKFVLEVFHMCSDLFELIKNFKHLGSKFNKSVHTVYKQKFTKAKPRREHKRFHMIVLEHTFASALRKLKQEDREFEYSLGYQMLF